MKSNKTLFYCTSCGNETGKWFGQCPSCGQWNTIVEAPEAPKSSSVSSSAPKGLMLHSAPSKLSELETEDEIRFTTGIGELDRVLGGGAVRGSVVLIGGAPGIGKSTLLLQICGLISEDRILYVTGEESRRQLKMRAQRLGIVNDNLYILAETHIDQIISSIENLHPTIVIIDSIQTIYNSDIQSGPGSISQVKDCTSAIMQQAKILGHTCFVVGHINKEGSIAGPKVLEHMVDCVLYFEGDKALTYRILRAAKNRFGSTNEIGVFEMQNDGLAEVPNPSEMLLSGRPKDSPGTCVTCVMEGTRPVLAEIQALVAPSGGQGVRRNSNGFDYNRAMLLYAVIEKRGGISLSSKDAYINVIGGLSIDETAADLAVILAVASSACDRKIDAETVAIGEVGLTGEIRSVGNINQRLTEIARLGFTKCIIPANAREKVNIPDGLAVYKVENISQAARAAFGAPSK